MEEGIFRVSFLGDPGSHRAPLVEFESSGGTVALDLNDKERLLIAYLALQARAPEWRKRAEVRNALFGPAGDDDLDRARASLEAELQAAGAGGVFRPYKRGADDSEDRDPRDRYTLRGNVVCDLADLADLRERGAVAEADRELERIRQARGRCEPLPLVDPRGPRKLPATGDWYVKAVHRFERAGEEKTDAESEVRSRSRVGWLLAGAGAVIVLAVIFIGLGGSDEASEATPECDRTGLTAPSDADLAAVGREPKSTAGATRRLPDVVMRSRPRSVAVGSDGVWVAQSTDGSLWRIDPKVMRPVGQPFPVRGTPFAVAVAEDALWVTRDDGALVALDRGTGEIIKTYKVAPSSGNVALGGGYAWVNIYEGRHAGSVARIDPCSDEVEKIEVGESANTAIYAFGAVWVSDSTRKAVHRLDPETDAVTSVPLDESDPQDLGAGAGQIWVVHYGPKRVTRIDPESIRRVGPPIPIGPGAAGAQVGFGALWLPNCEGDSLTRIDLKTLESDPASVQVGTSPTDLALGFGRVWVPNNDSEPPTVTPVAP